MTIDLQGTARFDPGLRDIARRVQHLRDTQEVVDALYRFGAGQDLRDTELFLSAFSPDAVLDFTQPASRFGAAVPVMHGREMIAGILTTLEPLATTHTVTNPRVVLEGDRAPVGAGGSPARASSTAAPAPPAQEHLRRRPGAARRAVGDHRHDDPHRLVRRGRFGAVRGTGVIPVDQRLRPVVVRASVAALGWCGGPEAPGAAHRDRPSTPARPRRAIS